MLRVVRILPVLVLVFACGPNRHSPAGDDTGDAGGSGSNPGSGSNFEVSKVYAHTGNTLYRVDSMALTTVEVGPLTGIGTESLTDLAVDKNANMVGITLSKLYAVDAATGSATLIKDLSQSASGFTSLSYIPTDLSDPNSADILVSANDQGAVYQIDPTSGSAAMIGSYGSDASGNKIVSSGDLIGVRNLGIYATVDVGKQAGDYLAQINPTTWKATPIGTGTGFDNIFGLGFWAGTVYGFTNKGQMITIDIHTGVGTMVQSGSQQWFGAGVTTDAPVIQ
jgi:hypothetical protein